MRLRKTPLKPWPSWIAKMAGVRRDKDLCMLCEGDDHSGHQKVLGCMNTVAPEPKDFLCNCKAAA